MIYFLYLTWKGVPRLLQEDLASQASVSRRLIVTAHANRAIPGLGRQPRYEPWDPGVISRKQKIGSKASDTGESRLLS